MQKSHGETCFKKKVYEAKFIEIENSKIIDGVADGTMNMNLNYKDRKYLAQLNKYEQLSNGLVIFKVAVSHNLRIWIIGGR